MDTTEKQLEKIEKLYNKAKSAESIGSLQEAELFMKKVRQLLLDYNLSENDLNTSGQKDDYHLVELRYEELVNVNSNDGTGWIRQLINVTCKFNLTTMVHYEGTDIAAIIGTPVNTKVVIQMIRDLVPIILNLCTKRYSEYSKTGGNIKKNKFRRDYLNGVNVGFFRKYKEEEEEMMASKENHQIQTTALVRTNEVVLQQKTQEFINNVKPGKPKTYKVNEALEIGKQDGKNLGKKQLH